MSRSKIITMCGSLKYTDKIMQETERLTLQGYNVISVIYETKNREMYTKEEIDTFTKLHFEKIDLADAIFVVNYDGHIGEGTKRDIEYANKNGKEIMYLESINI